MNQPLDKLFREKLTDYQKPAPANAWARIAAAQHHNSKKLPWIKIAASLSMLVITAYLLWPEAENIGIQNITAAEASKAHPNVIITPQPEQSQPVLKEGAIQPGPSAKAVETSTKNTAQTNLKEISFPAEAGQKIDNQSSTTDHTSDMDDRTLSAKEPSEIVATEAAHSPIPANQNITLVFTAKEVDEYLDKKKIAKATSDGKKASTLMKMLKKANNLKNNQDPFGELRQKKNEILALNFKSEKQRGQNK